MVNISEQKHWVMLAAKAQWEKSGDDGAKGKESWLLRKLESDTAKHPCRPKRCAVDQKRRGPSQLKHAKRERGGERGKMRTRSQPGDPSAGRINGPGAKMAGKEKKHGSSEEA